MPFTNTTPVVAQELIQGERFLAKRMIIDFEHSSIQVDLNACDSNLKAVGEKTYSIKDKDAYDKKEVNDTKTFVSGEVDLSYTPKEGLVITSDDEQTEYTKDVDYSISGKTVTSITITSDATIKASYIHEVPAVTDFTDMMAKFATINIYQEMMLLNIIDGTID